MADLWYIDRYHVGGPVDIGIYGPFEDNLAAHVAAERAQENAETGVTFQTRRVEGVMTVAQARIHGLGYARMMVEAASSKDRLLVEMDRRIKDLQAQARGASLPHKTDERVEYSLVWTIGRTDPLHAAVGNTEPAASYEEAIQLVLMRDRYEGRELADTEYDLGLIRYQGGTGYAELWRGPGGETFHAFVATARRLRRSGRATR